jgi:hypothetical protein
MSEIEKAAEELYCSLIHGFNKPPLQEIKNIIKNSKLFQLAEIGALAKELYIPFLAEMLVDSYSCLKDPEILAKLQTLDKKIEGLDE